MGLLSEAIYSGLVQHDESSRAAHVRKSKSLTASIITACKRANWYSFKNAQPDKSRTPNLSLLSAAWDGTYEHEVLDRILAVANPPVTVVDSEFGVSCKGIYARVDRSIRIGNKTYNLEFKTMSNDKFAAYCSNGVSAFPGYYAQCQVVLGAEPNRPLIFAAKCRGTSNYEDEVVERNPEHISKLVSANDLFAESLKQSSPPDRDFEYKSVECQGCEFMFRCWFAHLRADTFTERDLSLEEKGVIDRLFGELTARQRAYSEYLERDQLLRNYVAMLHSRHAVSKVKLTGLNSSQVTAHPTQTDKAYLATVLTDEQWEKAFPKGVNTYFRTTYTL